MKWPFFLFPAFALFACSKGGNHTVIPAHYYWSVNYNITGADSSFLRDTKCRKMYIRFFDVGLNDSWESTGEIIPKGRLENKHPFVQLTENVPVVYLENECFAGQKTEEDLKWLCSKITTKLFRMAANNGLPKTSIKEIQLDCDWTKSTRDNYFAFLKLFRQQTGGAKLSVTLRLYQYKYRDASGIPPADRCMLMYYNMSKLDKFDTKNYILDNATGKQYITNVSAYPLPLDFAFPVYSQGVEFYSEDSSLHGLRHISEISLEGKKILARDPVAGNIYFRDTSNNYYFTRLEYVTPEALLEAANIAKEAANTDTFSISFFDLHANNYKPVSYEKINEVNAVFGHTIK